MGSRLVVSVSIATTPSSCARAIHSFRRASVVTVSYLERSILAARAFSARAAASEMGVRAPFALPPPRCRHCTAGLDPGVHAAARRTWRASWMAGVQPGHDGLRWSAEVPWTSFASASIALASMPLFSATRRVMLLNSIALRKAMRCL